MNVSNHKTMIQGRRSRGGEFGGRMEPRIIVKLQFCLYGNGLNEKEYNGQRFPQYIRSCAIVWEL